jgi:hypothetical protein
MENRYVLICNDIRMRGLRHAVWVAGKWSNLLRGEQIANLRSRSSTPTLSNSEHQLCFEILEPFLPILGRGSLLRRPHHKIEESLLMDFPREDVNFDQLVVIFLRSQGQRLPRTQPPGLTHL